MLFSLVCTTALAFSMARNCTIGTYPPWATRLDITPHNSKTEIIVEPDALSPAYWSVRVLTDYNKRFGLPPLHLPPVDTEEGLTRALERAWFVEEQRRTTLRKSFTRLREVNGDDTPQASITPPQESASTGRQRDLSSKGQHHSV
jgi:hypothetical protein